MRGDQTVIGCELCAFTNGKKDRGSVGLESCDGFWLSGLSDDVNGLSDADRDGEGVEVAVKCGQHAGFDGECNGEQHVGVVAMND